MWESVLSISKVRGKAAGGFFPVGFSMDRHFLGPFSRLSVSRGEAHFFKQLAFCLLHAARRLRIAAGAGDALQGVDAEPLAQVLCRFIQRQQGLQRRLVTLVTNPFATLLIDLDIGLSAGAMVVQIGIQVLPIEVVDALGVARVDVAVADVLADDGAVFALHQAVVATLSGTAFSLLDEQLVEQRGDGSVDELAAVRCRCESP